MAEEIDIDAAILRLYFSIAISDSSFHDFEAGMIADQAALIARKIRAGPLIQREDVERMLGRYLLEYAQNKGKGDGPYPTHILQKAIDFIDDDRLRSTVLTQMLAIVLADGFVHNNEIFLLKHIAREWEMEEEFGHFYHLVRKIFKPRPEL